MCLENKSFENNAGKGEIARKEQFLDPFPKVFSTHLENFLPFFIKFEIFVCKLYQYGKVFNLLFGKGLGTINDITSLYLLRNWFSKKLMFWQIIP